MSRQGVDYSWARPGGATLKRAGKDFAVRYVPYPGHGGKGLDAAERDDLRNNGVDIAMVFESYAKRPLEGFGAGVADAQASEAALAALGMSGMPLYFAVDWDTTEAQQAAIDDYLRGAASVIGKDRVGVYGSYYVCKRCRDNGTAKLLWQTYAWSGGQVLDGIHLFQYKNGQDLNGAVDFTEARQDQFGQFGGKVSAPSTPAAPAPAVSASGTYTVRAGDNLSTIASRFGTTADTLAAINGIANKNLIFAGQVLRLSGATPAPAPVAGGRYTVVSGDNLSRIGEKFGVTADAIAAANGIANKNLIYAGQVLVIPGSGASPAPAAARSYTVASGDNLSGIAAKYGTTYQVLQAYNGIADANKIYPGQVIRIP
ncbi:LysM peptidoglycan-binding domain-containing protein [Candidatus Poribacteria bacterium]|nr:LysM peptidoglycan-binding domain-containing protein [Candidatus Poribacteria bacterium]